MIDATRAAISSTPGLNNSPEALTNGSNDGFDIIAASPHRRIALPASGRRHERSRMAALAGTSVLPA